MTKEEKLLHQPPQTREEALLQLIAKNTTPLNKFWRVVGMAANIVSIGTVLTLFELVLKWTGREV